MTAAVDFSSSVVLLPVDSRAFMLQCCSTGVPLGAVKLYFPILRLVFVKFSTGLDFWTLCSAPSPSWHLSAALQHLSAALQHAMSEAQNAVGPQASHSI